MKDLAKILSYARPYKKSIIFAFVCLTLTSVINLILPLIVRNMINAVVVLKNSGLLDSLVRDLFIIILLQAVFAVTHNYVLGFVGHRMTTDFRIEFFLPRAVFVSAIFSPAPGGGNPFPHEQRHLGHPERAHHHSRRALLRQTITLIGAGSPSFCI